VRATGDGTVTFVDCDVAPGARYGYRLSGVAPTEAWVTMPEPAAPAIGGIWPNPARSRVRVQFTAATAGSVTVDLLDVTGRRVRQHRVSNVTPGANVVPLEFTADHLAPGVYLVRVAQDGRTRTARFAVLR
jgi:hypothetical protein